MRKKKEIPLYKKCTYCGKVLISSEFHNRKLSSDGKQNMCKLCQYKNNKLRRFMCKDKVNETIRNWNRKNKERVKQNFKKKLEDDEFKFNYNRYKRLYYRDYVLLLKNKVKNRVKDPITARFKLIHLLKTNICDKDFLRSKGIYENAITSFFKLCKLGKTKYNLITIQDLDKRSKYWYKLEDKDEITMD